MPGLSEFTFYRTYSRKKDDDTLETWNECCVRVIEGMYSIFKTHAKYNKIPFNEKKAQRHAMEAADRLFAFKWTPPGRGLWMMGTDFTWERGAASLNNCGFISTENMSLDDHEELVKPFTFLMDMSMLGVGIGFDTRGADNKILVKGYSNSKEVFTVEDTRESWVKAIETVILNGFTGGARIVLDVTKVRPEGEPIRGFGGVASGPGPLIDGANGITQILQNRASQILKSTDIVDIQNVIGKVVVAGNVRRCLPKGTLVLLENNYKKEIENVEIGENVIFNGKTTKVTNKFDQGFQPMTKICLKNDKMIESTNEHKWTVFCKNTQKIGWVKTKDLKLGNFLLLSPK